MAKVIGFSELKEAFTPLADHGVCQAYYYSKESKKVELHQSGKGAKFFVEIQGKRIAFWMPVSLLKKTGDEYTHIKYLGIPLMKNNIRTAIKNKGPGFFDDK